MRPGPPREGVRCLTLDRFELPEDWPLAECWLELSPGGEALAEISFDEAAALRFGLDPYHRRLPLASHSGHIRIEAVARQLFGQPVHHPRLEAARLVWREPGVERLHALLLLLAETAEALAGHEVVPPLLALGEAALRDLALPGSHGAVAPRLLREPYVHALWSLPDCAASPTQIGDEVRRSVGRVTAELEAGLARLQSVYPPVGAVVASGHAHIDLAWLWPLDETRRKVRRSLANALAVRRAESDFRFVQSFADYYAHLETEDPALFAEVIEAVRSGAIEPIGAMWVEPDVVLPTGEALVRQLLYGQRYFERAFGAIHRVAWLPDTFGFGPSLPQLLRQAGVDTVFTTKLSWSETNPFPHQSATWEGLDGSQVYLHTINDRRLGYNGRITPSWLARIWAQHQHKAAHPTAYMTIGYGDGGGGPVREDMLNRDLLSRFPVLPRVRFERAADYFEEAERATKNVRDTWVGELYLEYHRGCYTSQAELKRLNRRAEQALIAAEMLQSLHHLIGGPLPERLEADWRLLLRNQFHDILPGSSIAEVCRQSEAELGEVIARCEQRARVAVAAIAREAGSGEERLLAINSGSRARPLRLTLDRPARHAQPTDDKWLLALDGDVPGLAGIAVDPALPREPSRASALSLENGLVRATFAEDGRLVSFHDKQADRELIAEPGAGLWVMADKPRGHGGALVGYDAWDLDDQLLEGAAPLAASGIEIAENGPHRAALKIVYSLGATRIVQYVRLWANGPRLDFCTDIDWQERRRLLKFRAPMRIHAREALFECAHGVVARSTHRNTSWDKARFEVCGHRFACLAEAGFGGALLTDSSYGYHTALGELGVSLLRAPIYPDPLADLGHHRLTYALMPFSGPWWEAGVLAEAEDLNAPLRVEPTGAAAGLLVQPLAIEGRALVSGFKRMEDSDDLVLRLYEPAGGQTSLALALPPGFEAIGGVDILERPSEKGLGPLGAYELRSIRIRRAPLPRTPVASDIQG